MKNQIIDTIYKKKVDIENCEKIIESVQENSSYTIEINFTTKNWKQIFGQENKIEISKVLLIKILEQIKEEQEKQLDNTINMLVEIKEKNGE